MEDIGTLLRLSSDAKWTVNMESENIKYRDLGVDKKVTHRAKLWTRSIAHLAQQRVQ
jgi:hypothetical protein